MTTILKQEIKVNLGKRKKTREKRGSYLDKWLDKTMQHIQEATPSMDAYDSFIQPNLWTQNPGHHYNGDYKAINGYGGGPEPLSLPAYPSYNMYGFNPNPYWSPIGIQCVNKSVQVQRPRLKKNLAKEINNATFINNSGYLSTQKSFDMGSNDFASLPPLVTSTGDTTSNSDLNANEKDDARRFSDPCLNTGDQPADGEIINERVSEAGSSEGTGGKLVACLIDQINSLKTANERLSKELNETRAELIGVRQQMSLWHKGSSTSSLGTGTPNNGLITSTACYSPGMLTDVVREMREAARLRDESLYAHVRTLVDERMRSQNNVYNRIDTSPEKRNYEDIKSELRVAETDKKLLNERLARMEEQMSKLKLAARLDENIESTEFSKMKRELTDSQLARREAEERANKLEQLVSQLRTKCNGIQQHVSPSSAAPLTSTHAAPLPSPGVTTVILGPVTDL